MMSGGGRGGGRGGGGMDRPHDGDFSYRRDNRERRTGWDVAPTSRHLWVGNLSLRVTENLLAEQFMRFGDLENIAYAPGRSYAFINFRKDEDAMMAMKTLQDFNLAGGSLRIEFAKPDRTLSSHDDPAYNEGRHFVGHGESLVRRDMRLQRPGPERSLDSSRGNKSSEPSEMLWIGFPASLDVDDASLRRAFSPFGEIDKITTFPGRSYAFIQYRSIVAACRAKDALHGKLFNNPRVSICFARTDTEHARGSSSTSFPSDYKSDFHPDLSGQGDEPFQRERSFGSPIGEYHMASPGFLPNMDRLSGGPNMREFGRNSVRTGAGPGANFPGSFEHVRLQDERPERRIAENAYDHRRISPVLERGEQWQDRSYERPWKTPRREESWAVEDGSFSLPKKPKAESFPDKELPEYPFNDTEQGKYDTAPRMPFPSFPEHHHIYNKSFEPIHIDYKGGPDDSRNLTDLHVGNIDTWQNSDGFKRGPGPSSVIPVKLEEVNPEPRHPPPKEEWKWEGMIAKGGTTICRARCLPVGKVLDFMLPEIINCTARTDLDMLAKHYYQAANTWVVFFVPENDTDMVSYKEFMHYLGEKQRAAVAKLDEKISLFLVPPSEFSEQVLKVPGKVCISGVILQFQQPGSNYVHNAPDAMVSKPPTFHHGPTDGVAFSEGSRQSSSDIRPTTQGQNYFNSSPGLVSPMVSSFPQPYFPGNNHPYSEPIIPKGNVPDFRGEARQDRLQHHNPVPPSDWPVYMHSNSRTASIPPVASNGASHSFDKSTVEEFQFANASGTSMASLLANNFPSQPECNPSVPSSLSLPLQPEQLAQLAALLGQHKKSGTMSSTDGGQLSFSQSLSLPHQSSIRSLSVSQFNPMQQLQQYSSTVLSDHQQNLEHYSSIVSAEPFSHSQQLQQQSSFSERQANHPQQLSQHASSSPIVQPVGIHGQEGNQQASTSNREEADPQRRLQATLQLAAALLQQIQQQGKPADQR